MNKDNGLWTYKDNGEWGKCNVRIGQHFSVCPYYKSNDPEFLVHCIYFKNGRKCVNSELYPEEYLEGKLFEL